jgi:hypothetical protein
MGSRPCRRRRGLGRCRDMSQGLAPAVVSVRVRAVNTSIRHPLHWGRSATSVIARRSKCQWRSDTDHVVRSGRSRLLDGAGLQHLFEHRLTFAEEITGHDPTVPAISIHDPSEEPRADSASGSSCDRYFSITAPPARLRQLFRGVLAKNGLRTVSTVLPCIANRRKAAHVFVNAFFAGVGGRNVGSGMTQRHRITSSIMRKRRISTCGSGRTCHRSLTQCYTADTPGSRKTFLTLTSLVFILGYSSALRGVGQTVV